VSHYLKTSLRADAVSGFTVAILGIPQAMAFAMLAGLPPIYGLYTSIFSAVFASLFGSSSHLVTGPTNSSCLILFSVAAPFVSQYDPLQIILLLTFIAGIAKLVFGLLRLGAMMRYVSNSVLVGFMAGSGALIAVSQLKNLLGLSLPHDPSNTFFGMLFQSLHALSSANPAAVGIGISTALIIVLMRRINRNIPGPLLGLVLATAVAYLWGLGDADYRWRIPLLRDVQSIHLSLRHLFGVPELLKPGHFDWRLVEALAPGAIALAFMGLIQTSSSARAVAVRSGQRVDFSRDFMSQGLTSILGPFFQSFEAAGSFTRSAVCFESGGRTRLAPILSSVFTLVVLLVCAPMLDYIPQASLAGVILVVAFRLTDRRRLALVMQSGRDSRLVFLSTLAATLILPLQYAIFVGVFLSIVFLLRVTSRPDLTLLVPRGPGRFEEVPFDQALPSPIVLVNIEGDLHFAAVENLDLELQKALNPQTRVVILRMKRLRAVGSSAMAILEHFWQYLRDRNIYLVACGIEKSLEGLLTRSGLREQIGEQNLFYADNTLFQSTDLALARARAIVEMELHREHSTVPLTPKPKTGRATARELISRQCIRFGIGHSVREAIWLLSEMNKVHSNLEPHPLFLQDREGKLAGQLSPWRLLEAMTQDLTPEEMERLDDAELGRRFGRCFDLPIQEICGTNLPRCPLDTPLALLVAESVKRDQQVMPILDDGGRAAGSIGQHDLLLALGQILIPPTAHPEDEIHQ
jgi:SulP family sulfate permease